MESYHTIETTRSKKRVFNYSDLRSKQNNNYDFADKTYVGKRSLDIVLSIIGLSVYALIFPLTYLGTKLSSSGP